MNISEENNSEVIKRYNNPNYYNNLLYYTNNMFNNGFKPLIINDNGSFKFIYKNDIINKLLENDIYKSLQNGFKNLHKAQEQNISTDKQKSKQQSIDKDENEDEDEDEDEDKDKDKDQAHILNNLKNISLNVTDFTFNKGFTMFEENTPENIYYYHKYNPSLSVCLYNEPNYLIIDLFQYLYHKTDDIIKKYELVMNNDNNLLCNTLNGLLVYEYGYYNYLLKIINKNNTKLLNDKLYKCIKDLYDKFTMPEFKTTYKYLSVTECRNNVFLNTFIGINNTNMLKNLDYNNDEININEKKTNTIPLLQKDKITYGHILDIIYNYSSKTDKQIIFNTCINDIIKRIINYDKYQDIDRNILKKIILSNFN